MKNSDTRPKIKNKPKRHKACNNTKLKEWTIPTTKHVTMPDIKYANTTDTENSHDTKNTPDNNNNYDTENTIDTKNTHEIQPTLKIHSTLTSLFFDS